MHTAGSQAKLAGMPNCNAKSGNTEDRYQDVHDEDREHHAANNNKDSSHLPSQNGGLPCSVSFKMLQGCSERGVIGERWVLRDSACSELPAVQVWILICQESTVCGLTGTCNHQPD